MYFLSGWLLLQMNTKQWFALLNLSLIKHGRFSKFQMREFEKRFSSNFFLFSIFFEKRFLKKESFFFFRKKEFEKRLFFQLYEKRIWKKILFSIFWKKNSKKVSFFDFLKKEFEKRFFFQLFRKKNYKIFSLWENFRRPLCRSVKVHFQFCWPTFEIDWRKWLEENVTIFDVT